MRRFPSFLALLAAGLLLATAGCDSGPDDDGPPSLDATFEATTFTVTRPPLGEVNVLEALDGSFTMDFDESGTVAVNFAVAVPGQDDIDERTEGTYELDGDGNLTFDFGEEGQDLREKLREQIGEEPTWTYADGVIRTEGDDYEVVLERQ
jgi:hypothetical protein